MNKKRNQWLGVALGLAWCTIGWSQEVGGVTARLTDSVPAGPPPSPPGVSMKFSDRGEALSPPPRAANPPIPEARPLAQTVAGNSAATRPATLTRIDLTSFSQPQWPADGAQVPHWDAATTGMNSGYSLPANDNLFPGVTSEAFPVTGHSMIQALTQNALIEMTPDIQSIELLAGASRRLNFPYKVAEVIVESPEFVRASPVSATQVTVTGMKLGISTITFGDPSGQMQTIAVNVKPDVRKAQVSIAEHFPDSAVKVSALSTGIVLSGHVARSEDVDGVLAVARDFFPANIVNLLQVEGAQVVAIEVKVYEVSRSKLRRLGIDWSVFGANVNAISGFGELIQNFTTGAGNSPDQNFALGVINDDTRFNLLINALEQKNVAKLLSQPTLVAQNGRPAEFLSGGEIPFQIANGFGTNSIQFRPFGTKLDFVPIIEGEGHLTLEVRAEVSEIANDLSFNTGVPGFRVRRVNTGVPMRHGQTLALAGDYSEKSDSKASGAPVLVNIPFWGSPFRTTQDSKTETELVFLITPRFIDSVDPEALAGSAPGRNSVSPTTRQLIVQGQIEVPGCPPSTDVLPGSAIPVYPASDMQPAAPYYPSPEIMPQSYQTPVLTYPRTAGPQYWPSRR